jgi:hypothetical protein
MWATLMLLAYAGLVLLAGALLLARFAQQQYLLRRRS